MLYYSLLLLSLIRSSPAFLWSSEPACRSSTYECCPDDVTAALGPDLEGCPSVTDAEPTVVGSEMVLSCIVPDDAEYVSWTFRRGGKVYNIDNGEIENAKVESTGNVYNITVNSIKEGNSGVYSCTLKELSSQLTDTVVSQRLTAHVSQSVTPVNFTPQSGKDETTPQAELPSTSSGSESSATTATPSSGTPTLTLSADTTPQPPSDESLVKEVPAGSNVDVNCSIPELAKYLSWSLVQGDQVTQLDNGVFDNVQVLVTDSMAVLSIDGIDAELAGSYVCEIQDLTSLQTATVQIDLVVTDNGKDLEMSSHTNAVMESVTEETISSSSDVKTPVTTHSTIGNIDEAVTAANGFTSLEMQTTDVATPSIAQTATLPNVVLPFAEVKVADLGIDETKTNIQMHKMTTQQMRTSNHVGTTLKADESKTRNTIVSAHGSSLSASNNDKDTLLRAYAGTTPQSLDVLNSKLPSPVNFKIIPNGESQDRVSIKMTWEDPQENYPISGYTIRFTNNPNLPVDRWRRFSVQESEWEMTFRREGNTVYYFTVAGKTTGGKETEHSAVYRYSANDVDLCTRPMDPGACFASLPRWYFDSSDKSCKQFIYGGCGGNGNEFKTERECQNRCDTQEISTETPKSDGDLCARPMDSGVCFASLSRWYFDSSEKSCKQFIYGGCGGNGNMFRTERECLDRCDTQEISTKDPKSDVDLCTRPMDPGACFASLPRWYFDSSDKSCKQFIYGGCGGNGNEFKTERECQNRCDTQEISTETPKSDGDLCARPMDSGACFASLPRWYFDSSEKSCKQFIYGGCGGNGNMFRTERECLDRCDTREISTKDPKSDMCSLASASGSCSGYEIKWYFDSLRSICRRFVYTGCDGNENRFDDKDTCKLACETGDSAGQGTTEGRPRIQTTTPPLVADMCSLASASGSCGGYEIKWYFDSLRSICRRFVYTGCDGNENRFDDQDTCKLACESGDSAGRGTAEGQATSQTTTEQRQAVETTTSIISTDLCIRLRDPGMCFAQLPRWYFDSSENSCRQFIYGGCGGNGNMFRTERDCLNRCDMRKISTESYKSDMCSLASASGSCGGYEIKWYFDSLRSICRRFVYTGCDGNENRFDNQDTCKLACETGDNAGRGTTEGRPRIQTTTPLLATDMCSLASASGSCGGYEIKWYFDSLRSICRRFVYTGCDGNENRFDDQDTCKLACETGDNAGQVTTEGRATLRMTAEQRQAVETTTPTVATDLCIRPRDPGMCFSQLPRWYFDNSENSCRRFTFGGCGGNGNVFRTERECQNRCDMRKISTETPKSDMCSLASASGSCGGYEIKWYFDSLRSICRRFVYTGCDGNENRFDDQDTCKLACETGDRAGRGTTEGQVKLETTTFPVISDMCSLASASGSCGGYEIKWYFDSLRSICRRFVYTGCDGNENRFDDQDTCKLACETGDSAGRGTTEGQVKLETTTFPVISDMCSLASASGSCGGYEIKWYFDSLRSICRRFVYTGCDGNENRFDDQDTCKLACESGDSAGRGTTEGRPRFQTTTPSLVTEEGHEYCPSPDKFIAVCDPTLPCAEDTDCRGQMICCWSNTCGGICTQPDQDLQEIAASITNADEDEYEIHLGDNVILKCDSVGSPRPTHVWYKDRKPIQSLDNVSRYSVNSETGNLEIRRVSSTDTAEYICRASNGVGASNYLYINVVVKSDVTILDSPNTVEFTEGGSAILPCEAKGTPSPIVSWQFQGFSIPSGSSSLYLTNLGREDEGIYTCTAYNGISSDTKDVDLVLNEPLQAELANHNKTYSEGERLVLTCITRSFPPANILWQKDEQDLKESSNIRLTGQSLTVSGLNASDSGMYTCVASTDRQKILVSTSIRVQPAETVPASCGDRPELANCGLIVQYNYCGHPVYRHFCCKSCLEAGKFSRRRSSSARYSKAALNYRYRGSRRTR